MDRKIRGKIINALRKLTFSFSGRIEALARQKRGPATHECQGCGRFVYSGAKELQQCDFIQDLKWSDESIEIIKGKTAADHIKPVIPTEGFGNLEWDWNIVINNMFVPADGWQILCNDCHIVKTAEENRQRQITRKKNKKKK